MPPGLSLGRQLNGIKGGDERFGVVSLTDDFDAVGGISPGCHVDHKASANPPPARLFAMPLEATAGPGQLFSIEKATAGANHPVGEVSTGAVEDVAAGPGMV